MPDTLFSTGDMNSPADLSDSEVIDVVLGGERDAYRHLVSRHKNMIFALLLRQTGDAVISEELSQACFVRAFFSLKTFRRESRFSTWLVRIALNLASSHFSSRRFREAKLTESYESGSHDLSTTGPEEEREKREFLQKFRTALGSLKSRYRDVLVLCALEGKSYEEAAQILEIHVGTVRSRLNTARLMLREKLPDRRTR